MSVPQTRLLSQRVRGQVPELQTGGELAEIRREPGPLPQRRTVAALEGFTDQLTQRFLSELPSIRHPSGRLTSDRKASARYLSSIDILQRRADSIRAFRAAAVRSKIELHVPDGSGRDGHRHATEALIQLIRGRLDDSFAFPPSVLTADLVAKGSDALHKAIAADLPARASLLTQHIGKVLIEGGRAGVFGRIHFVGRRACRFEHSRFHVWHEESVRDDITETRARTTDTYRHKVAVHVVHLMNAMRLSGIPAWLRIPERFVNAVNLLPDYLLPYVSTVDGRLIHERVATREIMETSITQEIEMPLFRLDDDPAILIGNTVLFGWTARDIVPARGIGDTPRKLRRMLARLHFTDAQILETEVA